ncbi:hypothetical protein THERMOS_640 [Bathymodiolus thermophilus thioautotrophic gill symbiont]|uniref:Uncharacterized protein n=1 Tax=Bathymodiolus thermophilus thioautotrophic gill symbiont TaxID=2360 RepID=A0A8H9CGA1_9GAMM|nr:hypothetical protein THERMOS_640 [Bathymodiolus thermophilus thioautotrophic gill symbiont]
MPSSFVIFSLSNKTPAYSIFSKIMAKIEAHFLSNIFNKVKNILNSKGYLLIPHI